MALRKVDDPNSALVDNKLPFNPTPYEEWGIRYLITDWVLLTEERGYRYALCALDDGSFILGGWDYDSHRKQWCPTNQQRWSKNRARQIAAFIDKFET